MSDFPKGGDVATTRAWLDRKGYQNYFIGWEADALLGIEPEFINSRFDDKDKAAMLRGFLNTAKQSGEKGLEAFEFHGIKNINQLTLFPANGFGGLTLDRLNIVNGTVAYINNKISFNDGTPSVYFSGIKGSGKSSLLLLIAVELKKSGYKVFYLENAQYLEKINKSYLTDLLNRGDKVAMLVDEIQVNPDAALWTFLLKSSEMNLVTIGAGVPKFIASGLTSSFNKIFEPTKLFLTIDDEDFKQLIDYWLTKSNVCQKIVKHICDFICNHCGGHLYPTVKFMEYAFTNSEAKQFMGSSEAFIVHFLSEDFSKSEVYNNVLSRCFAGSLDVNVMEILQRTLGGKRISSDITQLERMGFWNESKRDFISLFLLNLYLKKIKPDNEDNCTKLIATKSPQENVEMLIVTGLEHMQPSDFIDPTDQQFKVEDGISFWWGFHVLRNVSNIFGSFQTKAETGRIDYYFDGNANLGIEALKDAVEVGEEAKYKRSQDINEYLDRFVGLQPKYTWKSFGLLNFACKPLPNKGLILPRKVEYHDRVYTFVHSSNILYQGKLPIKAPAVKSLPCKVLVPYIPLAERKSGFSKKLPITGILKNIIKKIL